VSQLIHVPQKARTEKKAADKTPGTEQQRDPSQLLGASQPQITPRTHRIEALYISKEKGYRAFGMEVFVWNLKKNKKYCLNRDLVVADQGSDINKTYQTLLER
jgi:hypothetical protein